MTVILESQRSPKLPSLYLPAWTFLYSIAVDSYVAKGGRGG